jgi:hypothetical protein
MPFLTALLGGLLTIAGSLVGRVLLALGMGFVTFKGFDLTVSWLLTQIKTYMGSMPADVLSFLAWCWVDKAIGMVFAAYTAAIAVKAAGGSGITKLVTKGGS